MSTPKPKRTKKQIALGIVVGVAVALVAGLFTRNLFSGGPTLDESLRNAAAEVNKTTPKQLDEETRLDSAESLPNRTFRYNITLVSVTKSEVDAEAIKDFVEPNIMSNVKSASDLKAFRDNNITIVYRYKDKDGELLFDVEVTPDEYN